MTDLRGKAVRAAAPAHVLLQLGDSDGAANRAYYAMFDVARLALDLRDPRGAAKTHSTIITRFSEVMVLGVGLDAELGRALRRAHEARALADYSGDQIDIERAREMVAAMDRFLATVLAVLDERP